jgi:hypothetical protein
LSLPSAVWPAPGAGVIADPFAVWSAAGRRKPV